MLKILFSLQNFKSQYDQYRKIELLGEGSTCEVWRVQHKTTNEKFAMKIISTSASSSTINREIKLLIKSKDCKHIVHYKESFARANG